MKVTQSCPTFCDPWTIYSPWDSLGQNSGVGNHSLLLGIFLTQGSSPRLLHWQVDSLTLCHLRIHQGLQVHSLHLCLYSYPETGFISSIFLDSIYMCVNTQYFFSLSDLLHCVWQTLGSSISLQMAQFCSLLWLISHCIYVPTQLTQHCKAIILQ